tara:strand:+ start:29643 stop:30482 length:840 start_codon:yes stop_codon:yes gene_type:complete
LQLFLLCALLQCASSLHSAVILVPEDVLQDYKMFVGDAPPASVTDFGGSYARRPVVELVLLLQALTEGGYNKQIILRTTPGYAQTMRTLVAGGAHLSGVTQWKQELAKFAPRIGSSFALIRSGEYQLGVFACKGQPPKPNIVLSSLAVVADERSSVEWSALQWVGFKRLEASDNLPTRVRLVCLGRVDAAIAEFPSSATMGITAAGFSLQAIPNIKLVIEASRHYPVSSEAMGSQRVALALNRGLKLIRRSGVVKRALLQSGFHHPQARQWKALKLRSD